ncbi:MAG: recombination-associated protein RdgC [Lysobacterales bacterium CG02_land_8_20_14_3_00_62_12]|nr:MAG: recombination-associated protein RdgC [Xanthomonadales bacterium CG02_land_8_20_14_3_00_62_12]
MFFRNISLFRFPATAADRLQELDSKLGQHLLRPCGPLELSVRGWVSPFGRGSEVYAHGCGPYRWLTLGGEDKLLPAAVVNQAIAEKVEALESARLRPVSAKEKKKLKDEVLVDLMPRALARPSRLSGYLDTDTGWLLVDSASNKAAETFVSKLREALGSFPAVRAEAEESPRAVMTEWLIDSTLPTGFALGDECELKDPADRGAIVRCRRQELDSDEIREHLKCGKLVSQLGLNFQERMQFVLDDTLTMRKFKLLDGATEVIEKGDRDSVRAELDARFALMSHELAGLLTVLEKLFGVPRPQGA